MIKVDPARGLEDIGCDCAAIVHGFKDILEVFSNIDGGQEPGGIIPDILGAPENVRSKLDQYSWGNPEAIVGGDPQTSQKEFLRRATTMFGYWVKNELLEFPGALLNPVAAAAYLDVDHKAFAENHEYQEPFNEALYEGPFAELGKWWWKPSVNVIRA